MKLAIVAVVGGCVTGDVATLGVFARDMPAQFTTAAEPIDPNPPDVVERRASTGERARTAGGQAGVMVTFARHVVTGFEFELGGTTSTSTAPSSTGGAFYGGGSLLGGLSGRLWRVTGIAEVALGVHTLDHATDDDRLYYQQTYGTIEGRLRAQIWLWKYLTVDVLAGRDQTGADRLGLGIGIHAIANDDDPRR